MDICFPSSEEIASGGTHRVLTSLPATSSLLRPRWVAVSPFTAHVQEGDRTVAVVSHTPGGGSSGYSSKYDS